MASRRKYSEESINKLKRLIRRSMEDEGISNAETLVGYIRKKYPDVKPSVDNFYHKLGRGTLRAIEEREIADVLGYDVVWVKRK